MLNSVFLALGSNMGDRDKNLSDAVRNIAEINGVRLTGVSAVYETEPVGYTEQAEFLNMVIAIETDLQPIELLKALQGVERELKRTREIHWGPRTIDIDILLFNDIGLASPELTIPHPRMMERAFVLFPLKDVYGEGLLFGKTFEQHIDACEDKNGIKLYKKTLDLR